MSTRQNEEMEKIEVLQYLAAHLSLDQLKRIKADIEVARMNNPNKTQTKPKSAAKN